MIYRIIDILFIVFHTSLTLFNLAGWIWKKSRRLNLVTLLLTGSSWLFLGWLVGTPGYCPLTDWHFRILEKTGVTDLPGSYIKYLIDRLTGLDVNANITDRVTLWAFVAVLAISLIFNTTDFLKKRRLRNT